MTKFVIVSIFGSGRFLFRSPNEGVGDGKSSQTGSGLKADEIMWGL